MTNAPTRPRVVTALSALLVAVACIWMLVSLLSPPPARSPGGANATVLHGVGPAIDDPPKFLPIAAKGV